MMKLTKRSISTNQKAYAKIDSVRKELEFAMGFAKKYNLDPADAKFILDAQFYQDDDDYMAEVNNIIESYNNNGRYENSDMQKVAENYNTFMGR